MSSRLRSRELRLGRSFQVILVSVLAAPLAAGVACGASGGDAGSGAGHDGGARDATLAEEGGDATLDAASSPEGPTADAASTTACESVPFDGAAEGDQDGCATYRALPCGLPSTARREGCFIDLATCIGICGCDPSDAGFFIYCQLSSASCDDAGNVRDAATIVEFVSCNGITGRRPLGLCPARVARRTPLGDYFAVNAHLEAASVRAFQDLARWLGALGAPRRLAQAARRSAEEERSHARSTARLARRFGGIPAPARARRVPSPSLAELLVDDAVEGCVKETFGALLATWQAAHAGDRRVRRTMQRIALDETRHAALAWEILAWGMPRLTSGEQRRVEAALGRALRALESGTPPTLHPRVREVAGHPTPARERRLAIALASLVRDERARWLAGRRPAVMRERPLDGASLG